MNLARLTSPAHTRLLLMMSKGKPREHSRPAPPVPLAEPAPSSERSAVLPEGLAASVVAAMPLPTAVVEENDDGVRVLLGNGPVEDWLTTNPESLAAQVRRAVLREESVPGLRVRALASDDGIRRWILVWQLTSLEARVAQATVRWDLSERQAEVLEHVADGKTNKAVGEALGLAANTVELHVTHLLTKAGARNRTALVAAFWRMP
jgi:DNA-binding CsgD family transcriptional regulator